MNDWSEVRPNNWDPGGGWDGGVTVGGTMAEQTTVL